MRILTFLHLVELAGCDDVTLADFFFLLADWAGDLEALTPMWDREEFEYTQGSFRMNAVRVGGDGGCILCGNPRRQLFVVKALTEQ